ncbi:ATP phosphoribosyltransferase [Bacteroidota bacterium]
MSNQIRIAIQKSGRLSEESLKLIKECGIKLSGGKGKLKTRSANFPAEFLFLRDDDIPGYVYDQVADAGIVGENVALEKGHEIEIVKRLGFSKCRLSLAIPKEKSYTGVSDFSGLNIATSYPHILNNFLSKHGISADIHEISGSVEIAPSIGLADAVCDIVSSGSTLISNGLKEVETILESEAVLVTHKNLDSKNKEILDDLIFRINSVQRGINNKYILLNAPNDKIQEIIDILPGIKSPTIVPLAMEGWSSLHSVINEDSFWDIIDQLKKAGAEGILVVPIEKMIY